MRIQEKKIQAAVVPLSEPPAVYSVICARFSQTVWGEGAEQNEGAKKTRDKSFWDSFLN